MLHRLNIAAGNFFFRFRNGLFPVIYIALLVFTRPAVFFGPAGYHAWIVAGAVFAALGQFVRLFTIGFKYIERGGRAGKVYASFLQQGGIYAHTRNPMYVGNGLIAVGLLMYSGSPLAAGLGIPFFLFVYQAITVAEENYLSGKFGADFDRYRAAVNRFFPSLKGLGKTLSELSYDGKRAVRKEYGTVTVVVLLFLWLPVWRSYFLDGKDAALQNFPIIVPITAVVLVVYCVLRFLKKSKRLEPRQA